MRPLFFTCLGVLLLLVPISPDLWAQNVDETVALREVGRVGDGADLSLDYLLGRPQHVRTDPDGHIYVADAQAMDIKVFAPDGSPERRIGERGQGPGEFQDLTSMHLTAAGRLAVFDRMNARLTLFSPEGEVVETQLAEGALRNWIRELGQLSTGAFVAAFYQTQGSDDLLHIISEDFAEIPSSFAGLEELGLADEPYTREFTKGWPGRIWVTAQDEVLFAPLIYPSEIYRYARNRDGAWERRQTLQSEALDRDAITPLKNPPYPDRAASVNTGGDTFRALVHQFSMGVFELEDGRIAHFSLVDDGEEERIFGVELFDADGQFLHYHPLETLSTDLPPASTEVFWKDETDRFYVRDEREGAAVRIVELIPNQ